MSIQDPSSLTDSRSIEDEEWPLTLFFEKKNVWLEQLDKDLRSQGIAVGDTLELKVKPKLVRVYIRDEQHQGANACKMIKYMPTSTVSSVLEQILEMRSLSADGASGVEQPLSVTNPNDFGIFLSHNGKPFEEEGEGLWLVNDKKIASYNLSFNDSLYFSKLPSDLRQQQSLNISSGDDLGSLIFQLTHLLFRN